MRILTHQTVKELTGAAGAPPCVTVYMPVLSPASPANLTENQIRLKNLLIAAADSVVRQYGEDHPLVSRLSDWLEAHIDDRDFWDAQTDGLLLLFHDQLEDWYNLPLTTDEYVGVDDSFHLAPVLAVLEDNVQFYVLLVNQHNPKLFIGDAYQLHIADIGLPDSLETALHIDEQNQQQVLQGSASGQAGYNGRGGDSDIRGADRLKFFRMIDRIVCTEADKQLPVILAGTESEIAEYRAASKCRNLLQATVNGSRADLDMRQLQRQAVTIVTAEIIEPAKRAAVEDYERLEGTNPQRVASDPESIATAINQGRVDKLLASLQSQTTDNASDNFNEVIKITFPSGERGRLINRMALKVWDMSGKIISLTDRQMPHGTPMVARLRY